MSTTHNRRWLPSGLRTFRIAWSTGFLLASAVFAVYWVRSYRWMDSVTVFNTIAVGTLPGTLNLSLNDPHNAKMSWFAASGRVDWDRLEGAVMGFGFVRNPTHLIITAPFWFVVPVVLVLATAPWIGKRWRFNLRIMLIAVTLIALLLGFSVWLSKFPGFSKSPFGMLQLSHGTNLGAPAQIESASRGSGAKSVTHPLYYPSLPLA